MPDIEHVDIAKIFEKHSGRKMPKPKPYIAASLPPKKPTS